MATKETKPAEVKQEETKPAEDLVLVRKDGRKLRVHPTCVPSHEACGWELDD